MNAYEDSADDIGEDSADDDPDSDDHFMRHAFDEYD